MKVCVVQPHYSFDERDAEQCFEGLLELLDQCDDSLDLIVLPEYSDAMADVQGKAGYYGAVERYNPILMERACATAKRCKAMSYAPDLTYCVGWDGNLEDPLAIVDRAVGLGAQKVQLFKPYFNQETVDKAHAHGVRCNVFCADTPEEAKGYLEMGIDTVLTNDYWAISQGMKK